jgi:dTDP-4-dehydrorhamnose reductase
VKALVLGAAGLLGSELMRLLPDAVGLTRQEVPVTDLAAINGALPHYQADVVFNCAAYNAVDAAEGQQEAAYQVNAQGAFNVALACAEHKARLIHFSTNFVFSGAKEDAYVEGDEVGPLGVYGKSKLEGEKLVAMVAPRALIIRTAAVFGGDAGRSRLSFPEKILARAAAGERVTVVSDQTVNPTYAADLAAAAIALAASDTDGAIHVVGGGCCAWDELARATLAEFGVAGAIEPVGTTAIGGAAPRPRNGCLGSTRTQPLRPWPDALREWALRRRQGGAKDL